MLNKNQVGNILCPPLQYGNNKQIHVVSSTYVHIGRAAGHTTLEIAASRRLYLYFNASMDAFPANSLLDTQTLNSLLVLFLSHALAFHLVSDTSIIGNLNYPKSPTTSTVHRSTAFSTAFDS